MKTTLLILLGLMVAGCGGGSSSGGGGNANNDVTTQCLSLIATDTVQNTCDFAVNIGSYVIESGSTIKDRVTLQPNQVYRIPGDLEQVVACRLPAIPVVVDEGRRLTCS